MGSLRVESAVSFGCSAILGERKAVKLMVRCLDMIIITGEAPYVSRSMITGVECVGVCMHANSPRLLGYTWT